MSRLANFLFTSGQRLTCFSCGELSTDMSKMKGCPAINSTIIHTCKVNEACVTYVKSSKEYSGKKVFHIQNRNDFDFSSNSWVFPCKCHSAKFWT